MHRVFVLKHKLFTSSGFKPFTIMSQTLKTDASAVPHCAAPKLGITAALFDPHSSEALCCLKKVKKTQGDKGEQ